MRATKKSENRDLSAVNENGHLSAVNENEVLFAVNEVLSAVNENEDLVNADYIAGLIESDGSFTIGVNENKSFGLHISISSLTNTNNFSLIKTWLAVRGINGSIYRFIAPVSVTLRKRTPETPYSKCSLKISGNKQVEKFLRVLKQEITSDFMFCGVKQRDYLLFCAFLKTKQQKYSVHLQALRLAIKKSLHKSTFLEVDSSAVNIKTREMWEVELGLGEVSSPSKLANEVSYKTLEILQNVDQQYCLHQSSIRKAIGDKSLKVAPSFIAGILDGDGSFYVTVSWKEPNCSYSKRHIHWEGCFTLSTDKNSYLVFDLLKYVFNLPLSVQVKTLKKTSSHPTWLRKGKGREGPIAEPGSYQMWVRNQTQIRFMLTYLSGKLCGHYRLLQYYSVCKLFELRSAGLLQNKIENVAVMKDFLSEVYEISAISKKGSLRNPPKVEEALAKTDIWFRS